MVLQIVANPRQVLDDVDSKFAESLRFPDSREHQKLRTADRAGSKNHFLVGTDVLYRAVRFDLDAHAPGAAEVQLHHVSLEQQRQVRPCQHRTQEGASRTYPRPVGSDVHVDVTRAGEHGPVHVVEQRHAHLAGGSEENRRGGMRVPGAADMGRAADSTPGVGTTLPILLRLENRKHVGKGPALGSVFRPAVVVPLHAAVPHHGVDAAAAPQDMTEGHVELPIVQARRRSKGQVIVERSTDVVEPDAGVRDRGRVVGSSGLDDQHLRA